MVNSEYLSGFPIPAGLFKGETTGITQTPGSTRNLAASAKWLQQPLELTHL
jgi:hypothetical protein